MRKGVKSSINLHFRIKIVVLAPPLEKVDEFISQSKT